MCQNTFSFVSFTGMNNKGAIFWIGNNVDVSWEEKSPPVQVKEPYSNLDMITCRLSSFTGFQLD